MCEKSKEYKETVNRVKDLIKKRKRHLFEKLPVVHKIDDGVSIRFFSAWSNSKYHKGVKYRKIDSIDNSGDKNYLAFLPKGTYINIRKHDYSECLICLDGKISLDIDGQIMTLDSFTEKCIKPNVEHSGKALVDTYIVVKIL